MLSYGDALVAVRIYGQGPAVAICLHGFLEQAESFALLSEALPGYTLVAIDLPFHGETIWPADRLFRTEDLIAIIRQCPEIGDNTFCLAGYSMGGKLALAMYEKIPEQIRGLVLMAPDGLKADPWHAFSTRTKLGKWLLKRTTANPKRMLRWMDRFYRLGVLNQSLYRFVTSYMEDPLKRKKVYHVWTTMHEIRPDRKKIQALIRQHGTIVQLVFGKYDRLCPSKYGYRFSKHLKEEIQIQLLESGHLLLREKHLPALSEAFGKVPIK